MGIISLCRYVSDLYTISILALSMLLLEVVLMVQRATRILGKATRSSPSSPSLAEANSYMRLIAEKYPATWYQRPSAQPEPAECPVCLCGLEEEEIRELQCRHTFHKECLDKWLQQEKNRCPMCRRPVVEEEAMMEQLEKAREYCEVLELDPMFFSFHGGNLGRTIWSS